MTRLVLFAALGISSLALATPAQAQFQGPRFPQQFQQQSPQQFQQQIPQQRRPFVKVQVQDQHRHQAQFHGNGHGRFGYLSHNLVDDTRAIDRELDRYVRGNKHYHHMHSDVAQMDELARHITHILSQGGDGHHLRSDVHELHKLQHHLHDLVHAMLDSLRYVQPPYGHGHGHGHVQVLPSPYSHGVAVRFGRRYDPQAYQLKQSLQRIDSILVHMDEELSAISRYL